jgi:type IV secretion system protein VirD4
LLTPGEVMQLPPQDELVLVSGLAPIRAKKLRYYEDRNFTARVCSAPLLAEDGYLDCPDPRPDDWGEQVRSIDIRLQQQMDESATATSEDSPERQRHPGLSDEEVRQKERQPEDPAKIFGDDTDAVGDEKAMQRAREAITRAHATNEGDHRKDRDDLLPGF